MMIIYENECVGCTGLGLRCLGPSCKNRNIPHFYCDACGEETELYYYDGGEYCADCILGSLEMVEGSER